MKNHWQVLRLWLVLRLFALLVVLLFGPGQGMANTNSDRRAAAALFQSFESVLYAEGRLLAGSGGYRGLTEQDADRLRAPFVYLPVGLEALGKRAAGDALESAQAVLLGAREFRSPKGLGVVSSQFCFVVVFWNHSKFTLSKNFAQPPVDSAVGSGVWNWSAELKEFGEGDPRPSSLYATQIGNEYLLVSNNLQELRSVAERLVMTQNEVPALSQIRDWESFSKNKVWGYRRYRHTEVVDRVAAGMDLVANGAEALSFYLDSGKKSVVLRLLLNPPTAEVTPAKMNAKAMFPPLEPEGVGVWETTFRLRGDERSFEQLFLLAGLFGFAVYL